MRRDKTFGEDRNLHYSGGSLIDFPLEAQLSLPEVQPENVKSKKAFKVCTSFPIRNSRPLLEIQDG